MPVEIEGKPHKSSISRKTALEAANFFAETLFSPKLLKRTTITIIFCKKLRKTDKIYGDCTPVDDSYYNSPHPPREIEIRIDATLKKKDLLETIAHEMVHAQQYASRSLQDTKTGRGNRYWNSKAVNEKKTCYYFLPWEIEAYGKEVGLSRLWYDHRKNQKKNRNGKQSTKTSELEKEQTPRQ